MQPKPNTPLSTRVLNAIVILLCLLYALGAISQQPAPPATWHPTEAEAREIHVAMSAVASLVTLPAGSTATYRIHGPAVLNDLTVTPGAAGTTPQATLCSPSFHTSTVRNVPQSMKQRVCRNYGVARADCVGTKVEIDHLISLELGGTNDEANLWPQPYAPAPGAKEKDIVENWLHRQVCSNAIPLAQAQHEIATDWYQVYLDLNAPPAGADDSARKNTTYYSGGISHVWSADGTQRCPVKLRAKLDTAQRLVAEARMLLQLYVDDEKCSFDHHGDCQTHGCSNPCSNQLAKAWLEATR